MSASEMVLERIAEGAGSPANDALDGALSITARARAARARNAPQYRKDLNEVAQAYKKVLSGDRYAALNFVEAMTTSDFSYLFGDVIDRLLYANYMDYPVQWEGWAKRTTVRDFRPVKRFTLDGGQAGLQAVPERSPYPAQALTDGDYTYSVGKYGEVIGLSWESMINDDLGAFRDLPQRLARSASRQEQKFATALMATAGGPNSAFFSSGNKNLLPSGSSSALDLDSLQAAFTLMRKQVDPDGFPIFVDGVTLMVPPDLEVTANNILHATSIQVARGSGGAGASTDNFATNAVWATNWMANRVKLVVNPYLPLITTSGTLATTAWYLFADPNEGRPAAEMGFLVGHETPELFAKTSNAIRIGGGLIDPSEGDFDTDQAVWKCRHVFGGVTVDPRMAVASPGQ